MFKNNILTSICLSLTLVTVTGCSYLPDWWGEEDKEILQGERSDVLKTKSQMQIDSSIQNKRVNLSRPTMNNTWPISVDKLGKFGNLAINGKLKGKKYDKFNVGKSVKRGKYYLPAPIVANGKIFAMDGKGAISAYAAKNTKKQLWRSPILPNNKPVLSGGLHYHKGIIYATGGHNNIIALREKDGSVLWHRTLQGLLRATPVVQEDTLFINTTENRLYALEAGTGQIVWTHRSIPEETTMLKIGAPAISPEGSRFPYVIVPYSSGELFALTSANGQELWAAPLIQTGGGLSQFSDIDANPIFYDGTIYAVSYSGVLSAINARKGTPLWEVNVASHRNPWIANDFIYVVSNDNRVLCIERSSGKVKWINVINTHENMKNKKGRIRLNDPIVANGRLFIAASHGKMFVIDPQDGKLINTISIPEDVYASPAVAFGNMYLLDNKGNLTVVN